MREKKSYNLDHVWIHLAQLSFRQNNLPFLYYYYYYIKVVLLR